MTAFTFRFRFDCSPSGRLNIDAPRWEAPLGGDQPPLVLCSPDKESPIKESGRLVFKSDGWATEADALMAAEAYFPALALTLAKLRVGADYGLRAPKGAVTTAGLALMEEQSGSRVLNDEHGLMVYESEPAPLLVSMNASGSRLVPQDRLEEVFSLALKRSPQLADKERLALTLFNSSFFQDTADSRFLLLMMAIEAMLDPPRRSEAAGARVEDMIVATQESTQLTRSEKDSLLGSLKWLRLESISHTGRAFAAARLGGRTYGERTAAAFFTHCYGLRSRLVHGLEPFPTREEVDAAGAQMELFVSDVLTGNWLGLDAQ